VAVLSRQPVKEVVMRRLSLTLLATTAAFALVATNQVATAADLPRKAPPPMVATPPPLWNWTGFYLGGHFGMGLSRNELSSNRCDSGKSDFCAEFINPFNSLGLGSHNGLGVLGGLQIGYNWQFANSPIVVGLEGTYSWADLKADHQVGQVFADVSHLFSGQERFFSKISGIATIVGRLGIASGPQDRTLWYVKGGGAWAKTKLASAGTWTSTDGSDSREFFATLLSGNRSRWGWTVGTGVEWGLFDNWSAKIEYDYLQFNSNDVVTNGTLTEDVGNSFAIRRNIDLKEQIHMVTVGLNYRFNWWR
jgi:outer membrane immunogenic protein